MEPRRVPPALTGTEQRLDLILDELTAIRKALTPVVPVAPQDGEPISLSEPAKPKAKRS